MARMNPRQSEKAFLEAIEEFQAIVRTGKDRALGTSKTPAGAPASSTTPAASGGETKTVNGTKFIKRDGKWYQTR
jgi:hypothetical protein